MPDAAQLKAATLRAITDIEAASMAIRRKRQYADKFASSLPEDYAELSAMCLALIDRATDHHAAYYEQALREVEAHESLSSFELASVLLGIVRSLKRDVEHDSLDSVRALARRSMMAELMHMAASLLDDGCAAGAAVVLGSLLDVHLRDLVHKHGIAVAVSSGDEHAGRPAAEALNALLGGGVYGELEQQAVADWLSLWRAALRVADGSFASGEVERFLRGLRVLMVQYPA